MATRFYLCACDPGREPVAPFAREVAVRFREAPATRLLCSPDLRQEAGHFAEALGLPVCVAEELGPVQPGGPDRDGPDRDGPVPAAPIRALEREARAVGDSCVAVVLSPEGARLLAASLLELSEGPGPDGAGALHAQPGTVILIDWSTSGGRAWLVAVDPDWCPPRAFGTLGAREKYPGGPA